MNVSTTTRMHELHRQDSKLALWEVEFESLRKRVRGVSGEVKGAVERHLDDLATKYFLVKAKIRSAANADESGWGVMKEDLEKQWQDVQAQTTVVKDALATPD